MKMVGLENDGNSFAKKQTATLEIFFTPYASRFTLYVLRFASLGSTITNSVNSPSAVSTLSSPPWPWTMTS
jgi:hypothetical protein